MVCRETCVVLVPGPLHLNYYFWVDCLIEKNTSTLFPLVGSTFDSYASQQVKIGTLTYLPTYLPIRGIHQPGEGI